MPNFAQELNSKLLGRCIAISLLFGVTVGAISGCKSMSRLPGMGWMASRDTPEASLIVQDQGVDQQKYPPPSATASPQALTGPTDQIGSIATPPPTTPLNTNQTKSVALPTNYPATDASATQTASIETPPIYQSGPYATSPAPGSTSNLVTENVTASNPMPNANTTAPIANELNTPDPQPETATSNVQNIIGLGKIASAPSTAPNDPADDSGYSRDGGWIASAPPAHDPLATARQTRPSQSLPDQVENGVLATVPAREENSPPAVHNPVTPTDPTTALPTASLPSASSHSWRPGSTSDYTIIR